MDSQEDIVYPNDPKAKIKVDDDLKQLFREIELPRDMVDIEKELQKNGIKPMTNTANVVLQPRSMVCNPKLSLRRSNVRSPAVPSSPTPICRSYSRT
ncbi:hypothetical protein GUJ93_ZPchr0369g33553 [Zizania palustris]|uniref:Uncharacterized protein n=1 Tax=Zizania palustris TaxID=103762 RepID=A0A8J5X0K4_ZIZPA|nr:hypothetical protein GUJ93_ZPchr0369g33553 [Zizania palustris]